MNVPPLPSIKEPSRGSPRSLAPKQSFRLKKAMKDANRTLDNLTDAYLEEWAGKIESLFTVYCRAHNYSPNSLIF